MPAAWRCGQGAFGQRSDPSAGGGCLGISSAWVLSRFGGLPAEADWSDSHNPLHPAFAERGPPLRNVLVWGTGQTQCKERRAATRKGHVHTCSCGFTPGPGSASWLVRLHDFFLHGALYYTLLGTHLKAHTLGLFFRMFLISRTLSSPNESSLSISSASSKTCEHPEHTYIELHGQWQSKGD